MASKPPVETTIFNERLDVTKLTVGIFGCETCCYSPPRVSHLQEHFEQAPDGGQKAAAWPPKPRLGNPPLGTISSALFFALGPSSRMTWLANMQGGLSPILSGYLAVLYRSYGCEEAHGTFGKA